MPTSVRSETPWRYEKLTPGQPTSNAIASRSGLTVSPVTTDQWPGAPAGAPVAAVGAGAATAAEAASSKTAISAQVRVMRSLRCKEGARRPRDADLRRQGIRGSAGECGPVRAARFGEASGLAPDRGLDGDGRSGGGARGGSR